MSASSSTIIGSLPPSSRLTGVSLRAARSITLAPVAHDPVNWMKSELSMTASDTSRAPCASANTSGAPESCQPRSSTSAVSGVRSDGFEQHRAACGQCADGVHQGVGHRVVPRRDDADDRTRAVVHGDLLDRQERQRRGPRLRRERLLHRLDVVRQDHDQQRHLLRRVDGRLAGLLDQQRLDLVAVLAEPDGVAGEHLGAALGAARLPFPLRLAQAGRDARHVGGVGPAHLPGDGAGGGVADGRSQTRASQLLASRS